MDEEVLQTRLDVLKRDLDVIEKLLQLAARHPGLEPEIAAIREKIQAMHELLRFT